MIAIISFSIFSFFEFNKKRGALSFDYDLINRLGDNYVQGQLINMPVDEYNKTKITSTLNNNEHITYFLPDSGEFSSISYFVFGEMRQSFDIKHKYVYEVCFKFDFSSSLECDLAWEFARNISYDLYKTPQFVDDLFCCQSLIFTYNHNTNFKYILRIDSKTLIYIAFDSIESVSNIVFDKKYCPTKTLYDSSFPKKLIQQKGSFHC